MSRTNYLRRRALVAKNQISTWAFQRRLLLDKNSEDTYVKCESENADADCHLLPKMMCQIVQRFIENGVLEYSTNDDDVQTLFCDGFLVTQGFHFDRIYQPQWVMVRQLTVKEGLEVLSSKDGVAL